MSTATQASPYTWGTGRRKTAVARVRIREGTGQFQVNGKAVDEYFETETQRNDVRAPAPGHRHGRPGGRLRQHPTAAARAPSPAPWFSASAAP